MTQRVMAPLPGHDPDSNECVLGANDGATMRREWGDTPNGNPLAGRWVLRDAKGDFLDFNQYRHDLMEHNGYKPHY